MRCVVVLAGLVGLLLSWALFVGSLFMAPAGITEDTRDGLRFLLFLGAGFTTYWFASLLDDIAGK